MRAVGQAVGQRGHQTNSNQRTREGLLAALISYTLWGFLPIYFKIVATVPAAEVLAHRVLWAVPFGLPIVLLRRQWPEVTRALRTPRMLGLLALAAALIAVNWLVYIWAVQNALIFQASLGYYINPIMYVLVGVIFFSERLHRMQTAAVLLAAAGVAVLTISGGEFPLISLTLATSFTIYGTIRSRVVIDGMPGLFVETLVLLPAAVAYLFWLAARDAIVFASGDWAMSGLLMLAGPFTVIPLLCFALAARRLRLSTIGVMQFIAPTLQFLVGLAYGEVLTGPHVVCFVLIWTAVTLFSWDAWRQSRAEAVPAAALSPRG
ncbi:MAG TPA: EamA family transporter RarD [Gammaproteobacteria bacterium]|nr:EamA family transporter RarD [Gammaproteobacteria bacterium]